MAKLKMPAVEELSEGTQQFFDVLNQEDDLAVIVIAASYLDASLGAMLKRHLREGSTSERLLDPQRGAVGSFATRADLCYSLQLIDKGVFQDLIRIAEIRNMVAHNHFALSFDSPQIGDLVRQLQYPDIVFNTATGDPLRISGELQFLRNRFVLAAVLLSQRLLVSGLGVQRSRGPAT